MIYYIVFLLSLFLDSPEFSVRHNASRVLEYVSSVVDVRDYIIEFSNYKPSLEKSTRLESAYYKYYTVYLTDAQAQKIDLEDFGIYPNHSYWDTLYVQYFGGSNKIVNIDNDIAYTDYSIKINQKWVPTAKAEKLKKELLQFYLAQRSYDLKMNKEEVINRALYGERVLSLVGGSGAIK